MKIYFIRHGEGLDDVYNEFGAWSDRELSPNGIRTAFRIAEKLKRLDEDFEIVLTSPLRRASKTAEIVGTELNIPVQEEPYLKERNTYGLLSGVNKEIAIGEYPEMNAAFLKGEYIPASERYEDFVSRVKSLVEHLKSLDNECIICATHGHLITTFVEEYMDLVRNSVSEGCILGIKLDDEENFEVIHADGVTFTKDEDTVDGLSRVKFKET